MSNQCNIDNCSHYISVKNLRFYRNKFIYFVIIATVAIACLFAAITYSYHNSLNEIVEIHKDYSNQMSKVLQPLKLSKDSCVYANEQLVQYMQENMQNMQSLLQLQGSKIQSDFTLLSVWAGILMIVFLIFSIYSIFKTDELMKQSRDGLRVIEDSKNKADGHISQIDVKVKEEIERVSSAADSQITKIFDQSNSSLDLLRNQVESYKKSFTQIVETKTNEFKKVYDDYVEKLDNASQQTNSLFDILINTARNQQSEEQESDRNTQEGKEKD